MLGATVANPPEAGEPYAVADEGNRRPPNRRALILEAAIQLFHERGYPATSVDDIGSAVDVSGPAIYRHFRNRLTTIAMATLHAPIG